MLRTKLNLDALESREVPATLATLDSGVLHITADAQGSTVTVSTYVPTASDPFARVDLLEAAMPTLPRGELELWPKLGHRLLPVREAALDRIARFLAEVDSAAG